MSMGVFKARILEWVAISFSRGFFRPRDQPTSVLAGGFLPTDPLGKPLFYTRVIVNNSGYKVFI